MPQSVHPLLRRAVLGALAVSAAASALAQHQLGPQGSFEAPKLAARSDEGEKNIKRFQVPAGWKVELFASEPDVAHGVAFDIANDGRVFVAETFRAWRGVPDIRGIMSWLDEDLACKSIDDRLLMMKRHLGEAGMKSYYQNTERVRYLRDENGDGKADVSKVFAENFATPLDGVASGVLARGKDVYFANIPNVWHLRDENLDGLADARRSISYGHGVRVGFLGHDLHGLTWGPDGKLYFSIGDRASVLKTPHGTVGQADSGSVFRCDPDGSNIEMIYSGLRNPQELVFDEWGNLFTGDNNSDGGDQARWTYLIEGGDSGWRIGWQFLEGSDAPMPRGPWNMEKMWHPQNDAQPAHITPPIKNITAGPSGNAYYPGTGLGAEWQGTFTLCDFRGSGANSGIMQFKHQPKGASFEIVEDKKMIWAVEATDGTWGPDGAYWVLDWVDGWEPVGKGRIYRMFDPSTINSPIVKETQKLLAGDFGGKSDKELLKLLAHANYRVRQAAQFELAGRGEKQTKALAGIAKANASLHARLHSIWGLGQIARASKATRQGAKSEALDALVPLVGDRESHVRANVARTLGDAKYQPAYDGLVKLTTDGDAHVRAVATIALGKLGRREAVPAVFAVLKANADQDPHLRHAAVTALIGCNDFDAIQTAAADPSESVRLGSLLAMRRLQRNEIAVFLNDASERIVTDAARAINDEPIPGAMDNLAGLIAKPLNAKNDALVRRVVNANYRFGTKDTAAALAQFANRESGSETQRVEALNALADWPKNGGRDRITGLWRPTAFARDAKVPGEAVKPVLNNLLAAAPSRVQAAAARTAGELKVVESSGALAKLVLEKQGSARARANALTALSQMQTTDYGPALAAAQNDPEELVRKTALKLSVDAPPVATASSSGTAAADPTARLAQVIAGGTLSEKQNAFATLAKVEGMAADALVTKWMTDLLAGKVQPELQLDVLDAAAARPTLKSLVAQWTQANAKKDDNDITPFKVVLAGGNAEDGKKVFFEKVEVSCNRCHKMNGEGGEVGPDLADLIGKKGREYALQAIIYPNVSIAQGFETVLVTLKNGTAYAGVIKSETADTLEINSPEDGPLKLKKADIESREKGLSGMPEGFGELLTKKELRDLMQYLAGTH
jgi:quinoprotein glucose dehydrogenase